MLPIQINAIFIKATEGDKDAFEYLFRRYYDVFYSTALTYLKVRERAEDVVQQVFMKLWEKRAGLTGISSPESYLFIMMRNEVLSVLRQESRRSRYRQRIKELFSEETGTPEQSLINKQKKDILEQAIGQLPPRQREAWRLSRDKGLSYEEIARAMHLALPTVKGHISAALGFIRGYLSIYRDELLTTIIVITLLWS
jgi:RNA polymerase sigma-70 factor (ECF subfamily)